MRRLMLSLVLLAGCKCFPKPEHVDECRAGCPSEESPCAKPSDTGRYVGYYVGGGAASGCCGRGNPPTREEGTWGWDYDGLCFSSLIRLDWWHGHRKQGGTGAYRVDGPRPLHKLEQLKEKEPESSGGE